MVFFHWGDQYKFRPNKNQVSLKEFCFIKGADIVIGAHPHVVQQSYWDENNDTYVAYSLGNFMAHQSQPNTSKGLVVKMDINKNKIENVKEHMISSRLYPINLSPYEDYINKFSKAVKLFLRANSIHSSRVRIVRFSFWAKTTIGKLSTKRQMILIFMILSNE